MRKPVMPYANNKGADQPAHPCSLISPFVVCCLDSIIPLVSISDISSLCLASVAEQANLSLPWSQTPKTGFLVTRLIFGLSQLLAAEEPLLCDCPMEIDLVTRKPVFGVCNQGRLKSACAATQASWRLEISDIETRGIILSRQRIRKALIRLCGSAGWSAPLLFACGKNRFLHDVAQLITYWR